MPKFVMQDWVGEAGLKMQSILLSGLRAPDIQTAGVKKCIRWFRGHCQKDADPKKQSYMQTIEMREQLIQLAIQECEYLTVHFVHHFADSMAVMAYFHPEAEVRKYAYRIHYLVAKELFHFTPESKGVFLARHADKNLGNERG